MSYKTIMVHMHIVSSNNALLSSAALLAKQWNTKVIGIMVGQQTPIIYGRDYPMIDFAEIEQTQLEKNITAAEALFRKAFKAHTAPIEWRSTVTRASIVDIVVAEARSADCIITGIAPTDFDDGFGTVTASEIVMQSGRPVLVVPVKVELLQLDHILVAWKETREARRAVVDALPMLQVAKQVTVVEIVEKSDKKAANLRLQEMTEWLAQHAVKANYIVQTIKDDDATDLVRIAKKLKANVVVAGAFGHSRLREWAFGGVTDTLLHSSKFCTLLSQ
jgi:nucleotide-binding universal stress UspA family protein